MELRGITLPPWSITLSRMSRSLSNRPGLGLAILVCCTILRESRGGDSLRREPTRKSYFPTNCRAQNIPPQHEPVLFLQAPKTPRPVLHPKEPLNLSK